MLVADTAGARTSESRALESQQKERLGMLHVDTASGTEDRWADHTVPD